MKKRIVELGLSVALILACMAPLSAASTSRETPLVRAIKRARSAVVDIHSEKTDHSRDALFSTDAGRKVNGMGTGIIVDERGYIVTNYHVVEDVDSLRVTLFDGSTYYAQVISYDRKDDLAIIKINPTRKLTIMPLGTSSDLMVGETVIAVGNAFGYEHTVTSGIVSALGRDVEVNETQAYKNLIQTDASINPGNSGGPLLNLDGEVVGINVAIRAGAQRIGFALPIDNARKVIAKLLSIEQLNHTYHGLLARDVKTGTQQELVVDSVQPNSPAAEAGFQSGDVVVKAGSVPVVDAADFERALLGRGPGEKVAVEIQRASSTETLTLTLEERTQTAKAPSDPPIVVRANNEETTIERIWRIMGVKLVALPDGVRNLAGTQYRGGMRVVSVRPGSPAERNGIRRDDILIGLHVWETVSPENVKYVLDHPHGDAFDPLKFYILRGGETLFGYLKLSPTDSQPASR